MRVGTLGNIVFEVSDTRVFTPSQVTRERKARIEEHQVQGTLPCVEFIAPELGTFSISMTLSAALGVNPMREADSLDDLYTRLKTKRYPHARLRRLVLDAALGFPAELPMPPYLHVLGARKAALPRLKRASLPAATALADLARTGPEAAKISRLHNKAVDFSSLCREKIQPMGLAFTAKPVVI